MHSRWILGVLFLASPVAAEEPRFLASAAAADGLVVVISGATNYLALYRPNGATLEKSWEQALPGGLATAEISRACLYFPPHQPTDIAVVVRAKDAVTGKWQHYWVVSWDRMSASHGRIDGPPLWDSQVMECVSVCLSGDSLGASFLPSGNHFMPIPTATYENCCTRISQVDHDTVGRYHITTSLKTIPDVEAEEAAIRIPTDLPEGN